MSFGNVVVLELPHLANWSWRPPSPGRAPKTAGIFVKMLLTLNVNAEVSVDLYAMPFGNLIVLEVRHLAPGSSGTPSPGRGPKNRRKLIFF